MSGTTGAGDLMSAAIYRRRGELDVVEVEVPTIGEGDVLVEVEYCGICGTDLHNVLDGWGQTDSIGGHEWSGVVVEAGPEAGIEVGSLVAGNIGATCGACDACVAGRPSLCAERGSAGADHFQGAFARYVAAGPGVCVPVPEGVDPRHAAYTEPLGIAMHAITLAEPSMSDRVLIFGAGPIGAAVAAVLLARGLTDVTVVEPGDRRRALAEQLGATVARPDDFEVPWHPGTVIDDPYDIVFETSGVRAATETALAQLKRAGMLMLVGTGLDHPRFDANRILLNELRITGAINYDADGFAKALDLIASGDLPLDLLLEPEPVPLDGMLEAMHALRAGELPGKVLVRPTRT